MVQRQTSLGIWGEPMSGAGLLLVSAIVTVAPVFIYIWILWVIDRYEKEPISLLGVAVASRSSWGR